MHAGYRPLWSAIIASPRRQQGDAQTACTEYSAKHRWTTRLPAATIARHDFLTSGGGSAPQVMLADEWGLHNTLNIHVVYTRNLGQSITGLSLPFPQRWLSRICRMQ